MQTTTTNQVAKYLLKELKPLGVYVYHRAKTSNSIYLKFDDSRLCSVRISDHQGIEKYRYKWNLCQGQSNPFYFSTDGGVRRFYFSFEAVDQFVERVKKYYATINGGFPIK